MSGGATAEKPSKRRSRHRRPLPPALLRVKTEPTDDIKDYAETTMNELLGWYGYDKVDSHDTQGLNLTHFAASSSEGGSGPEDALSSESRLRTSSPCLDGSQGGDPKSPKPDVDTSNLPPNCILCAWCQKVGMKLFTLKTASGSKAFCSELCFTQCRRASFKKNKVCDWCKHVRHTVNYVDFQDGEQQLQFCSDKCLNQYKMNIFCRETQAHLQMHPHLQESKATGMNLITPELWLRDCRTATSPVDHNGNASPERDDTEDDSAQKKPSSPVVPSEPVHSDPVNLTKRSKTHRERTERKRSSRSFRGSKVDPSSTHRDSILSSSSTSTTLPQHQSAILRSPTSTSSTPLSSNSGSTGYSLHQPTAVNGHSGSPPVQQPAMPPLTLPRIPPSTVPSHPVPLGPEGRVRPPLFPPHPMFQVPAHHHFDSLMRMQHRNVVRPGIPPPHFPFPPACAPQAPFHSGLPPQRSHLPFAPQNSLLPPATVMIPYPVFLPIPIPIPIPVPIRKDNAKPEHTRTPAGESTPASTLGHQDQQEGGNDDSKRVEVPERHVKVIYHRRRRRELVEDDDMRDSVDTEDDDIDSEKVRGNLKASRSVTSLGSLQLRITKAVSSSDALTGESCSAGCRDKTLADNVSEMRRDAKRKCTRH